MSIHYTVLDYNPAWMIHNDRRMRYETECGGCGGELDAGFVTIITDRSGSENAATHIDNDECIRLAIETIKREST